MYHKVGLSKIFFPPLRVPSKVKAALVSSKAKLVSILVLKIVLALEATNSLACSFYALESCPNQE